MVVANVLAPNYYVLWAILRSMRRHWTNNVIEWSATCNVLAWRQVRFLTGITIYHYSEVIMNAMASQITSFAIVYSTVYSGTDQRKHQSSASLAFVRGIHRWPVNSPHKGPVTRKMFPFDDLIMIWNLVNEWSHSSWSKSGKKFIYMHKEMTVSCYTLAYAETKRSSSWLP